MLRCQWIPCISWLCCSLFTVTAGAQLINGDDLVLTDPTPEVVFDDTDIAGRTFRIRGFNEYFIIRDESTTSTFFRYDPGFSSIAVGRSASAAASSAAAFGLNAVANGNYGLALGSTAGVGGIHGIAIGTFSEAIGDYSAALGYSATTWGVNSTALGFNTSVLGDRSTAIGYVASAPNSDTIILGSVPMVNGATAYANIGMGTNLPSQAVDVERSEAAARFQLTSFTNTANEAPQYIQRRARGTRIAPTAVQSNDNLGLFSFRGYNGSVMGGSRATITAQAAGNFSTTSTPTRLIFATTPVGKTAPEQVLVITPDGKVQVKGQNLNVPDYVFEDDYTLMPLKELREFIDANGHLPGISSAEQVIAEGHDLAGSDMAHLRKIEELTLYTLAQEERIEGQEARIEQLEGQVAALMAALARD